MNSMITIDMDRVSAFCHRWKVKELCLFGSVLREDFGADSDVDVLVDLFPGHGLTLYDWLDMIKELENLFGRRVDLVSKSAIRNPVRRQEILHTAEVVYAA